MSESKLQEILVSGAYDSFVELVRATQPSLIEIQDDLAKYINGYTAYLVPSELAGQDYTQYQFARRCQKYLDDLSQNER